MLRHLVAVFIAVFARLRSVSSRRVAPLLDDVQCPDGPHDRAAAAPLYSAACIQHLLPFTAGCEMPADGELWCAVFGRKCIRG